MLLFNFPRECKAFRNSVCASKQKSNARTPVESKPSDGTRREREPEGQENSFFFYYGRARSDFLLDDRIIRGLQGPRENYQAERPALHKPTNAVDARLFLLGPFRVLTSLPSFSPSRAFPFIIKQLCYDGGKERGFRVRKPSFKIAGNKGLWRWLCGK